MRAFLLLAWTAGASTLPGAFEALRHELDFQALRGPRRTAAADLRVEVKARLSGSGVPEAYVDQVFDDQRMRRIDGIRERFERPGESLPYDRYRLIFVNPQSIKKGREFLAAHAALLAQVRARTGVDPALLTALAGMETRYGANTGSFPVAAALGTIALGVPRRSSWAVRELAETLKLAWAERSDVHALKGSYAGAFGYVQFMPSSFNVYAVDFDGDGRRDLYTWPDALGSAANYLARHGYDPAAPFTPGSAIGRAIFAYNHSDNYVRAMLELREAILARP